MATCIFTALFKKDSALADRSVTISGSSIFYTSGDAAVWAHRELEEDDEEGKYPEYYSMFVFTEGTDSVSYRKNLAFNWKYNTEIEYSNKGTNGDSEDSDEEATPNVGSLKAEDGWFNMEIGFESYNFKKFTVAIESQQYVQTKDGKTTNYVIFYPHAGDNGEVDGVQAVIGSDEKEEPNETVAVLSGHIKIEFTEAIDDGYAVKVSDKNGAVTGEFNNVGSTFSKYSSSTTTPVTPLSFKAEFEEKEEDENGESDEEEVYGNDFARMVLYNLNGQSFRIGTYKLVEKDDDGKIEGFEENYKQYYVHDEYGRGYLRNTDETPVDGTDYYTYSHGTSEDNGHRRGGTINDNAPPVLCLTNGVSYVGLGKELPFDYQLIDVLASSPSADTYYYMLTNDQVDLGENFNSTDYLNENLFRMVTDSDNQYMEPHYNHYIPKEENIPEGIYDEENFKISAAVKVYLKLFDTRTETINQTTYVLLDWFIPEDKLIEVNKIKYIAVATDDTGVSFAYTKDGESNTATTVEKDGEQVDTDWGRLLKSYQALVDKAAKDIKAGSKNYFYLPSFENIPDYETGDNLGSLLSDNVTAYEDLNFNVYYNNGSNGNTSSKKSNALSINLTKAGRYIFTIYATDSTSNPMYYYKDGEKKTFTASNIWSMRESKKDTDYEGTKDYLPWFRFNVEASEIQIEDPGEREAAFVGTKYSSISFDINAVSYDTEYELYRFDNDVYYRDNGKALTYDEFMDQKAELLENHPEWFTDIPAQSTLTAGSDEYDEFYKYEWNNKSPQFVPQDANTFYVVKLTVSSTVDNLEPKMAYMGISASAKTPSLKGEDTWIQDNMTSIILLSIAGASLIGIVLLLVIKPKNKGDIDEQFEVEQSKKKSKK